MTIRWLPVAIAVFGCSSGDAGDDATGAAIVEGMYVFGAEVHTLMPCGSQAEYWVVGDAADELMRRYRELDPGTYEPIYVRVEGELGPRIEEGFAEHYDGSVRIDAVLDARRDFPPHCEDRPAGTANATRRAVYHQTVLDTLVAADGNDWLLLSGVECEDCDAPMVLWFSSIDSAGPRFPAAWYPGEHFEMGIDEEPRSRTRVFVGDCVREPGDDLAQLAEEPDSTGVWSSELRVVPVGDTSSVITPLGRYEAEIVPAVERGACREIPGRPSAY